MDSKQGYFSLVQYAEHPERAEFVNIGIVLFAKGHSHVYSNFAENPIRIKKVFGVKIGVEFHNQLSSLKSRLQYDFSEKWNRNSLNQFIDMRAGKIRLSPVRSVLVMDNPDILTEKLFREFVDVPQKSKKRERIDTKIKSLFKENEVEKILDKPNPEPLPYGGDLKVNYGYQNGSYNLIKGLNLDGDADEAWEKASPSMTVGRVLFDSTKNSVQKRLVAIGDVSEQSPDFISELENEMSRHEVTFYRLNKISPLIDDIRRNIGAAIK